MGVSGVSISMDDGGSVRRTIVALDVMGKGIVDFEPFLRDVSLLISANERAQFATEGAQSGRRFAELSDDYLIRKRKTHGRRKIMVATGRTRKALTQKTHGGDAVRLITKDQLVYGIQGPDFEYPKAHQGGYPVPGGFVRPRRPVDWDRGTMERGLRDLIRKHLKSTAEDSGLNFKGSVDVRGGMLPDL